MFFFYLYKYINSTYTDIYRKYIYVYIYLGIYI